MKIQKFNGEPYQHNEYTKRELLRVIKEKNIQLIDGKYMQLYHGTSPSNYKKILKTGRINAWSWFSDDYAISRRYALMATQRGEPVVMTVYINIDSIVATGDYFVCTKDVYMTKTNNMLYESNMNTYRVDMQLPNDIIVLNDLFKKHGKKLYVVGGCVRDFLLGKIPHDYDLVTDSQPEETKLILKDWNISDEQGKNFGVIRIYTESEPLGYELAVFRKDIVHGRDTKGDDDKVEIGKHITIEDDVLRRDFTQNALFYDIDKKEIVDLVGGYDDIKNNVIRAVGEPSDRFNEDRLRILRCFRFTARSHSKMDEKTADAIRDDNRLKGISSKEDVSQERIIEEIKKMFDYAKQKNDMNAWHSYLKMLFSFNMWEQIFPNAIINRDVVTLRTFDIQIFYAFLFNGNIIDKKFQDKLIREYKLTHVIVDGIVFLNKFDDLSNDIDNTFELKILHTRYMNSVSNQTILEYAKLFEIDLKFTKNFLYYSFTEDGNELLKAGFKGNEIGMEKKRRENDKFRRLMNEKYDF